MELQLGLALSCNKPIKDFDLNNTHGYDHHQLKDLFGSFPINDQKKKKRSFDEAFVMKNVDVPQTLPLLVWNSTHSNQEYDLNEASSIITNKNEVDENGVIGWPPVKSWRKKLCHQKYDGGGGLKSMYVKVKMEGVGIARKVDLSQHGSYQTLIHTLVGMFGKCYENVKLTYQDKEGDWLLAGDVPWGTFIQSVQRLKLLKNGCK